MSFEAVFAERHARERYERACERMEEVHCLVGSPGHHELVLTALDELDDAICVLQEFNVNGAAGECGPGAMTQGREPHE